MPSSKIHDELRILAPCGQLGQGWPEDTFWETLGTGVDAIIMDGGSTDSGPGRLAQGKTNVPVARLEHDLHVLVKACHLHKVPVLIGTAGGDGENAFVDLLIDIIRNTIKTFGYRPMKVIGIYSEIPKDHVREKLKAGLISPCGSGVPDLTEHDVETSTRIVAQMGLEPYLKAMEDNPGFDIIVGGRAYDPSPFAAYCLYKGFNNLGVNYAMGKIVECGALCSVPKSRSALAVVRQDNFDITPLDPNSKCTHVSVAAHFLYEKARPDILHGPGGALNLTDTTYEQITDRTVRVHGARFEAESEGNYTVKLEGARNNGYHTIFIGALRDPIVISQLDSWTKFIEASVREKTSGYDFDLKIHQYGINGVMGPWEPNRSIPKEVCIAGQVRAATQDQANQVASLTKFHFTHLAYPGQVATAGNFAWPFTPCEVPMGPLSEFCIYHIMHKTDPLELFPITVHDLPGDNTFVPTTEMPQPIKAKPVTKLRPLKADPNRRYYLTPEPTEGTCYLGDVACVVRSKNCGPYELTFDVMFPDQEIYERVKATGILTAETITRLYNIPKEDVVASLYWDPALAYKATIKRLSVSGGFGETDTHGSQQHIPLLYLTLPWGRESDSA